MTSRRVFKMTSRQRQARAAMRLAVLGVVFTSACYSYRPLVSTNVPERAEVRLLFSAAGAKELRESAGFEMRQLDGRVVRTSGDSAVVVKPQDIVTVDGDELPWRRGELLVPWRTVDRSQRRTIDKGRTRGFAAVMGAVFTGVVYFALKAITSGGGTTLQPGGGVPE